MAMNGQKKRAKIANVDKGNKREETLAIQITIWPIEKYKEKSNEQEDNERK